MPELTWPGKGLVPVQPASLVTDSLIFPNGNGYPDGRSDNRLILGENLSVMYSLLPAYEGKVNLIYADPPFFTNRKYPARIGRGEDSRKPAEWQMADGYHDHWDGLDTYLAFLTRGLPSCIACWLPMEPYISTWIGTRTPPKHRNRYG